MEKKYQIFISSTFTDLIEPRNKVCDAILSMMQFPIGMEMFSAADEEQWEIIQDTRGGSIYSGVRRIPKGMQGWCGIYASGTQ